eukprot:1161965-Pelagomonas_calceolata.AAC.6
MQYLEAAYGHEQCLKHERGTSKAIALLEMLTRNGGMLMVGAGGEGPPPVQGPTAPAPPGTEHTAAGAASAATPPPQKPR